MPLAPREWALALATHALRLRLACNLQREGDVDRGEQRVGLEAERAARRQNGGVDVSTQSLVHQGGENSVGRPAHFPETPQLEELVVLYPRRRDEMFKQGDLLPVAAVHVAT